MKRTTTSVHGISLSLMFFSLALLSTSGAVGQGVPNAGFEEWKESGKEPPFNWQEPTGWVSTNAMTEFSTAGVYKVSTSRSGTYACNLRTLNIFGTEVPAAIVTGNPTLNFSTYSVDIMSGGTPFTTRPDKLAGYYRFNSASDGDAGFAVVILKKYNAAMERADTVGIGTGRLEKAEVFTQFSIPIEYKSSEQPDSIVVAFLSSDPSDVKEGGVLVVDDVVLQKDGLGVPGIAEETGALRLYPNPVADLLHLELGAEWREGTAKRVFFYDLLGREVLNAEFSGSGTTLNLSLPAGLYTCRVVDGKREVVERVFVGGGE